MKKTKITLKEFFDSKDKLCIHCNTKEKANKLLNEFEKVGKKWLNGDSYINDNKWNEYQECTVYYNELTYACFRHAKIYGHIIYEFEDIIFENKRRNTMTTKQKLLKRLPKKFHDRVAFFFKANDLIDNCKYLLFYSHNYTDGNCRGASVPFKSINETIDFIKYSLYPVD